MNAAGRGHGSPSYTSSVAEAGARTSTWGAAISRDETGASKPNDARKRSRVTGDQDRWRMRTRARV